MSRTMRESFPTGRTFAKNLTGTARYIAAEKILADVALPVSGSVVALPQFAVVDYDGRESVNRIQWDDGKCVVVVDDDHQHTVGWKVEDSSLPTEEGTVTVTPLPEGGHELTGDLPRLAPGTEPHVEAGFGAAAIRNHLNRLVVAGKQDMFELVMLLLPYTKKAVDSAARRVYREIHNVPPTEDAKVIPVIDQVEADEVVDRMMYGEPGSNWSVITRLVRRAAATDAVVRKSVMQYVSTAVWTSAETHVRSHIGDPHAGRVIRRLARAIKSADPAVVLLAFRTTYPDSQMGLGRVQAALTADATVGARQLAFDTFAEDRGDR